ncbi:MAG: hypothetical protein ACI364_02140 [Coriobacteriales bacterium]
MNEPSQHTYGGSIRTRNLVFRGREVRERRWRLIRLVAIVCIMALVAWSVFSIVTGAVDKNQQARGSSQITVVEPAFSQRD